jgi:hypothetical protein
MDQADPGEVANTAAVIADRRASVLFQAVFVQLRATAMTAILHLLAPLLDDILVGQSLEVRINVVSIDVHCIGIAETGGRARSQRRVVTGSACLALVVMQVSELQIDRVAVGLKRVIVLGYDQEVRELIDVIGVQSLFEMIKQILLRSTSPRGPGLEVCHKLTEGALALLHLDDLVLCIGLGTDRLKFQFERHEEGVSARKRCLAFCKGFYVGSGLHSCVFGHERKGQGNHLMNIQQDGSICTLHFLSLRIAECKAIFIRIDPNAECTPKQLGRL